MAPLHVSIFLLLVLGLVQIGTASYYGKPLLLTVLFRLNFLCITLDVNVKMQQKCLNGCWHSLAAVEQNIHRYSCLFTNLVHLLFFFS